MERVATLIMLFVVLVRFVSAQPFSLDTTFNPTYAFVDDDNKNYTGYIADFYEEPDGRIILVGGFDDIPSTNRSSWLRLHSNGNVDYSWNPLIPAVTGYFSIHKNSTSYFFGNHYGITSTDLSGNMISGYSKIPTDSAFNCGALGSPYVFEDGSFLAGIGGCAYPHPGNVQRIINFMRVGTDGYVDTSFHHHANDQVGWTYPYDSTRILCYGNWVTEYDGVPVNRVFRIFKDGRLDTTFNVPSGFSRMGHPIHVQEDGKVILGRNYGVRGIDTFWLYRLHPDGRFDSTFNYQTEARRDNWLIGEIGAVCPTSDGGYLFGGVFESFGGYQRNSLVKTNKDGFVDTRYLYGQGIDSSKNFINIPAAVSKIAPGPNDTYYVMGQFLMFDGQPVKPIIRLLGLSYTVGLEEEIKPKQLKVFPNPASDYATFEWDLINLGQNTVLSIMDATGRVIEQKTIGTEQGQWLLNTRPLSTGFYLYELRSEGELLSKGKLLIE